MLRTKKKKKEIVESGFKKGYNEHEKEEPEIGT